MLERAYDYAERMLAKLDRVIALLEQLIRERDRAGR
jgi:hypothetical protein